MKKTVKKNAGFTLDISPEVADILGVTSQDDLLILVKDDEVILKPRRKDADHSKRQQEKSDQLTKDLIKKYASVLKKLAKT